MQVLDLRTGNASIRSTPIDYIEWALFRVDRFYPIWLDYLSVYLFTVKLLRLVSG